MAAIGRIAVGMTGAGAVHPLQARAVPLLSDHHKDRDVPLKRYHRVGSAVKRPRSKSWFRTRIPHKSIIPACLVACVAVGAQAAGPPQSSVSLTQAPLVMRLSKDEFRVAFGVNGERCFPAGCGGWIRYRVVWKTESSLTRSEIRRVNYVVSPNSRRSITVDRQYFDTAEGAHTTQVVSLNVELITCQPSAHSLAVLRAPGPPFRAYEWTRGLPAHE
jgi:hypothetical protein